jgi:hypothetical protein
MVTGKGGTPYVINRESTGHLSSDRLTGHSFYSGGERTAKTIENSGESSEIKQAPKG